MRGTQKQQYTIWLRWNERHRNSDIATCPVRRHGNGRQPDRLDSSSSAWHTHNACHVTLSTATPATNTTFAVTTPAQGYGIQVTMHCTHAPGSRDNRNKHTPSSHLRHTRLRDVKNTFVHFDFYGWTLPTRYHKDGIPDPLNTGSTAKAENIEPNYNAVMDL